MRRDTAANWTSDDTVLLNAEVGLETDTGWQKVGDGTTAWTSLPYYHGPPWISALNAGGPSSSFPGEPDEPHYGIMGSKP